MSAPTPIHLPEPQARSTDPFGQPSKLQPWHHDRLAVVYVRQSSPQQVLDHQESTRLQYGLVTRAKALGWHDDRILVIDDDLGKSASSAVGRLGFQRLVSEVSLDHVGLILGIEISRLARSSADWHQLLELCALFRTLIADSDGMYDPSCYNDRLLLGLKGTMSEAELHVLKQRMHHGRLNKARRGELIVHLPTGYVRRPSGEVTFDPDEQVQHVIRLIFRTFDQLGTLNAVLQYLVRHHIQIGIRARSGVNKGELEWHRPNRMTLQNLLKHPIYAGAYSYGRRQVDPRRQQAGRPSTGRVVSQPTDWFVLIKDIVPAYITWEQYEGHLARLTANRSLADTLGAPRHGASLLTGLVVCGICGCHMTVRYGGASNRHTYLCSRQLTDYGGEVCQSVAGPVLDQCIQQHLLAALTPAALEVALVAAQHLEHERADLHRHWQQRLERAAYASERAGRQYRLAEPEHRLVVRQLERAWNDCLMAQQQLEEAYHRFCATQPRHVTAAEQTAIRQLAADIPALWDAPTTTPAERKEILRQVLQRVVVLANRTTEHVQVTLEWVGGMQTQVALIRPVARFEHLSYYPQLCERLRTLVGEGHTASAIADHFNAEGYRPPKRRDTFDAQGVRDLLHRLGLVESPLRGVPQAPLPEHAWYIQSLACQLAMPAVTLHHWIRRGWVQATQQDEPPRRWVVWADTNELERLRQLHQRPAGDATRRRWVADAHAPVSEPSRTLGMIG